MEAESKFEIADRLLDKKGFWSGAFPLIAANSLGAFALAFAGSRRVSKGAIWIDIGLALGLAGLVLLYNLFRYRSARKRHNDLKLRFGDRYRDLVNEEKVVLNPVSILYGGQPKGVRWKYFNEGNPWD